MAAQGAVCRGNLSGRQVGLACGPHLPLCFVEHYTLRSSDWTRMPIGRQISLLRTSSQKGMLMPQHALNILLVAEITPMRRMVRHLLRQQGYDAIFEVDSGPEALQMLKQRRIDLVIADWHLTPMSSLELVQAVRTSRTWQNLPVLLMLSEASKQNIAAAGQAGATQILIKPFSATTLGEKIHAVFTPQGTKAASTPPSVPSALFTRRIV